MSDQKEDLPVKITATKVITFDVQDIITNLKDQGVDDPTLDDITDYVETSTAGEWGYAELILQDENGEDI